MDYEPFSVRQRQLDRQGQAAIYQYDVLSERFRVQVMRILQDTIGSEVGSASQYSSGRGINPTNVWNAIWNKVSFKVGLSTSISGGRRDFHDFMFSDTSVSVLEWLDAIEIAFRIVKVLPAEYTHRFDCSATSEQAISQLNRRFQRHDLGYAFEDDRLVRIDSQYMHSEVVVPALRLLNAAGFEGAQSLFPGAHEHFRHGENDDAILDAARAFETTMQHICDHMGWSYPSRPQAKHLISAVTENGLFPKWHQNHMNSLRTLLEGLPTVRNREAGHADTEGQDAPDEMAAFAIHLAASNIVLLVESFQRIRAS